MRFALLPLIIQLCAAEVWTEKVFGPETLTGPYKHPASITHLDDGSLFLTYYGGGGEYADATAVFGASKPAGGAWTQPRKLAADPLRALGNGVAWQAPDRTLWLFYVVRFGETWSSSRIQAKLSNDRGATWSDSTVLALDAGMMVRGRPILLASGEYLLPIYHETGEDREVVGPDSTSRFLRFDPKTRKWAESGVIRSRKGNIQPAPVEIAPGHVIAYCRRGGGYGPSNDGYIVRAESRDGGRTWSEGEDSPFPNPNSAVELIRLANGHLALIYNHSMSRRTPLRVAVSEDGGKTWPRWRDIGSGEGDFAYPAAAQTADGKIHVVFTTDRRKQIMHASFDESDIGVGRPGVGR